MRDMHRKPLFIGSLDAMRFMLACRVKIPMNTAMQAIPGFALPVYFRL
jgi:hypothetical protein